MVNLGQAFFFQGQSLEKVVKNVFILLISPWLPVFYTKTLIKCIKCFFTEMRTFLNISKTTEAASWVKEKSTEKEGGLARISAIEHEWAEDWFA